MAKSKIAKDSLTNFAKDSINTPIKDEKQIRLLDIRINFDSVRTYSSLVSPTTQNKFK